MIVYFRAKVNHGSRKSDTSMEFCSTDVSYGIYISLIILNGAAGKSREYYYFSL